MTGGSPFEGSVIPYNKQTKNEDSVHGERTLVTHPKNIKTRFLAVCKNNEESNMEPNL